MNTRNGSRSNSKKPAGTQVSGETGKPRACAMCRPCPRCRRRVDRGAEHKRDCSDSAYIRACNRPAKHWVSDPVYGRLYLCNDHHKSHLAFVRKHTQPRLSLRYGSKELEDIDSAIKMARLDERMDMDQRQSNAFTRGFALALAETIRGNSPAQVMNDAGYTKRKQFVDAEVPSFDYEALMDAMGKRGAKK